MGGRARDNVPLEDPHITSPDKAEGGDGAERGGHWAFGWRRGPNPFKHFEGDAQMLSFTHWFGGLAGGAHGRASAGRGCGTGEEGDGRKECADAEMDTTMRETGNTSRAKEVGE